MAVCCATPTTCLYQLLPSLTACKTKRDRPLLFTNVPTEKNKDTGVPLGLRTSSICVPYTFLQLFVLFSIPTHLLHIFKTLQTQKQSLWTKLCIILITFRLHNSFSTFSKFNNSIYVQKKRGKKEKKKLDTCNLVVFIPHWKNK